MPTIYVVTSDAALALITGKGKTLKKYTLKEDLALRKADMILEIGHALGERPPGALQSKYCYDQGFDGEVFQLRFFHPHHFFDFLVW